MSWTLVRTKTSLGDDGDYVSSQSVPDGTLWNVSDQDLRVNGYGMFVYYDAAGAIVVPTSETFKFTVLEVIQGRLSNQAANSVSGVVTVRPAPLIVTAVAISGALPALTPCAIAFPGPGSYAIRLTGIGSLATATNCAFFVKGR